jgi:hypothetical protein
MWRNKMSATADVFSTFDTEVKQRHDEMLADLESIDVDSLKSEGVTLSFGGKTFKFTDLEVIQDESVEEKLRREFKEKLNSQQQRIRDKINAKINQLLLMHQNKQQEFDRKERQLKRKYEQAALMPDINESHMLKGLSVVKGTNNDELIWIFRAKYNPRFILVTGNTRNKQRKALPSRLVNRMRKDMLILIKTKGKKITSVHTKKAENDGMRTLDDFPHYHQQGGGDCWGTWNHPRDWNTPDDIIRIAKEAEAILETINQGSIAQRGPSGLPRLDTILRNVEDVEPLSEATTIERQGGNDADDDVWQAI